MPLWQWDELSAAAGARAEGAPSDAGRRASRSTRARSTPATCSSRSKDVRDGHEFVGQAFKAGAAAAIVAQGYARTARRTARCCASMIRCGRWRAWPAPPASAPMRKIVAVTGSVGKTGTKEALRLCLSVLGATHASEKSYNNHWGVPLTLARMPKAAQYGVFEIGMNHAGEITPLTQMVRPHVAVITTVEPVHLAQFQSVEEIAEAKAEILQGLVPGGTAVLPRDNPHFPLLRDRAMSIGARLLTFGYHDEADFRCVQVDLGPKGSSVIAGQGSQRFPYKVGAPGEHFVRNSLAVLADAAGARRRHHARVAGAGIRFGGHRTRRAHPARRAGCRHSADRRELQRQSRLHARGAGGHGHHAARGVPAPHRRAGRYAGAG